MKAATVILVAAAALSLGVAPAYAKSAPPGPAHETTLTMNDCIDTVMSRAGWTTLVRPAVPERYGLLLLTPAGGVPNSAANFFIFNQYCEDVTVHGQRSVPTTTSYVFARVTSIDGQPVPAPRFYVLYIGTNNPQHFALFRSAGLPVDFLRTSSTTVTPLSETSTQVVYNIDSDEFGTSFTVVNSPPQQPYVFDTGGTWLYDAKRRTCAITWTSDQEPVAPAFISGTHFGSTLSSWLVTPLTITNVRFANAYRTGDHDVTVACDVDDGARP
jgi:hypothetical protein